MTNRADQPAHSWNPNRPWDFESQQGYSGMTIREKIAATIDFYSSDYGDSFVQLAMNNEPIPNYAKDPIGYIKYNAEFEAMIRVIRADALIAELSKPIT